MRASIFACFFVVLLPVENFAQTKLRGKVIDAEQGQLVPFATIRVNNLPIGTNADANGEFLLEFANVETQSINLICSSVGYASQSRNIQLNNQEEVIFYLKPASPVLKEVVVYSTNNVISDPEKIVKIGLKNLRNACPPHTAKASLQNYITENGKYRMYREASLALQDPKGYGHSINRQTEIRDNIKILQLRQSTNFLVNQLKFDNINNPLEFVYANGLKYRFRARKYEYKIVDTLYSHDQLELVILARQLRDREMTSDGVSERYDMKFYVIPNPRDRKDFKIRQFELNQQMAIDQDIYSFLMNTVLSVTLKDQGSHSAPDVIESINIQHVKSESGLVKSFEILSYNRLSFDTINFEKDTEFELLKTTLDFDPVYWKEAPINDQIKRDLAEMLDLDRQFEMGINSAERRALLDSVHFARWKVEAEPLRVKRPVYLVVYDDPQIFSERAGIVYEPVSDWLKKYGSSSVVFAGTLNYESIWAANAGSYLKYAFLDHYYLPYSWKRLIGDEGCAALPQKFIILRPSGEIICSETPFATSVLEGIE